jgi:ABC-type branched-subunit amino acid transport system ATPase component
MLVNEPSLGLEPRFIDMVFEQVEQMNGLGTTVLLVEQNAKKGFSAADRGFVLASGEIKLTGTGRELLENCIPAGIALGFQIDEYQWDVVFESLKSGRKIFPID